MPKIVDHDKYRQEMLEKCFYLFSRKGYSNITMKDIADEIGVSTGTLYHYFPSKEDILGKLITWAGEKNVSDYYSRTSSIDSIRDRFDLIVAFWKESEEFYQNIMLLAIDMYRNTDVERWKVIYNFFSKGYINGMSERLNISRQFASFIFIYFLGLSFHSLASPETNDYNAQIDVFSKIIEPFIVDVPEDREQAADKIQEIISTLLMDAFAPERETVVK